MVSKKRVKRKSLRLRNKRNTRSQTKSRRSKNRIGSKNRLGTKNKRRRSRNPKRRNVGGSFKNDTKEEISRKIELFKNCEKSNNNTESCESCSESGDNPYKVCKFIESKNLTSLFTNINELKYFLHYLRLYKKTTGPELKEMSKNEMIDEIKKHYGAEGTNKSLCIPFKEDILYDLANYSYKDLQKDSLEVGTDTALYEEHEPESYGFGKAHKEWQISQNRICGERSINSHKGGSYVATTTLSNPRLDIGKPMALQNSGLNKKKKKIRYKKEGNNIMLSSESENFESLYNVNNINSGFIDNQVKFNAQSPSNNELTGYKVINADFKKTLIDDNLMITLTFKNKKLYNEFIKNIN